jgi:hypothetical protein
MRTQYPWHHCVRPTLPPRPNTGRRHATARHGAARRRVPQANGYLSSLRLVIKQKCRQSGNSSACAPTRRVRLTISLRSP